jgi:hypothetical protein
MPHQHRNEERAILRFTLGVLGKRASMVPQTTNAAGGFSLRREIFYKR